MSIRRHKVAVSHGFGSRLAEVLADQRLGQSALAEKLEASPSFVSALVRGLKAPGAEFLVSLHDALGVSIDWLLTGKGSRYGEGIDGDLLQNILLQVRLVRLATAEMSPEAAVLLKRAYPDLAFGPPSPPPDAHETERVLQNLLKDNEDVAVAISIFNRDLVHFPAAQRSAAASKAIRDLIHSKRQPSILSTLKSGSSTKPGVKDDGINWTPGELPPGRKVGDVLDAQFESSKTGAKARVRRGRAAGRSK